MAKCQNVFSMSIILGIFFNLKNPNKFFRCFVAQLENFQTGTFFLQKGMRKLSIFVKELYDYILDTGYTGLQCTGGM